MVLRDVGEPRGVERLTTCPHTAVAPGPGRGAVDGGLVSEWLLAGANLLVNDQSSVKGKVAE